MGGWYSHDKKNYRGEVIEKIAVPLSCTLSTWSNANRREDNVLDNILTLPRVLPRHASRAVAPSGLPAQRVWERQTDPRDSVSRSRSPRDNISSSRSRSPCREPDTRDLESEAHSSDPDEINSAAWDIGPCTTAVLPLPLEALCDFSVAGALQFGIAPEDLWEVDS